MTYEIPKQLITVRKKPIINYLVDLFTHYDVDQFFVSVNEKHVDDFLKWQREHYPRHSIEFVVEEEPLGTFGPLMFAQEKLGDEPFFMSNGDELKRFDLSAMHRFHANEKSVATIALVKVEDPHQYGVAVCEGSRIKHFLEKPKNPPSQYINSGLYLLHPEIVDYFPHAEPKFSMVEKDLFPRLAAENKLHGYRAEGKWYDCGTFERWERAIREWE